MANVERIHESAAVLPSPEELKRRAADGWNLVALVWERHIGPGGPLKQFEEVPYGLQVAADCQHLIEHPAEIEVLTLALDLICQDRPLSHVADALNAKGYRTRSGSRWSAADVFELLPRLIDAGPRIFNSTEWIERRPMVRT